MGNLEKANVVGLWSGDRIFEGLVRVRVDISEIQFSSVLGA